MGARDILLKWPNDIWFHDGKIGGVLIEAKSDGAAAHVVVGVGLNLVLSEESRREIGSSRPAALAEACPAPFSRNALAAALLEELLSMLHEFERRGFPAFREQWRSRDALEGRAARVLLGDAAVEGNARGVDEDGALLLETNGRLQRFISGEASLRLSEDGA
jgi:BirA family biotin operon repressor/biotin-[acetyl-CoA-carboxylase] ligase